MHQDRFRGWRFEFFDSKCIDDMDQDDMSGNAKQSKDISKYINKYNTINI